MKYIHKNTEPSEFAAWRHGEDSGWQPSYAALDSDRLIKQIVRNSNLQEQGYICCYCMCLIDEASSHIEHIKPQNPPERFPGEDINYNNMVASCQPEQVTNRVSCGHAKGNWYEAEQFISPLDPECEDCFQYTEDGQIRARQGLPRTAAAIMTIGKLRLDHPALRKHREQAIAGLDIGSIPNSEGAHIELARLQQLQSGRFDPFCSALTYLLRTHFAL